MKLLLYYCLHTVKNQIRKLFKTWVAVFILICFAMGLLIGGGIAFLADSEDEPDFSELQQEETETETEAEPETEIVSDSQGRAIIRLACGGLVMVYLGFCIGSGSKNGSSVFQMADVNLLFSAPMKPQSVLFFRLLCQMGATLVLVLYLCFQIPNLHYNLGLSLPACGALLAAVLFTVIFGKLLSLLVYSAASTHAKFKAYVVPGVCASAAVLLAAFLLYSRVTSLPLFEAADRFFNSSAAVYVPVWGWIKGIVDFAVEGNLPMSLIMCLVCLVGVVLICAVNWSIKVDFYEDAMAKSSETAELQAAAQSQGRMLAKRKKDRSEKLKRNGKMRGFGANAVFFKEMYNRFRFGRLHYFTATATVYTLISVLLTALLLKLEAGAAGIAIYALVFGGLAFFRATNSPLAREANIDAFKMIPEKPSVKVFWTLLAGSAGCALDMLPGFVICTAVLRANPLSAVLYLFGVMTFDFYSSGIFSAIDLSLPVSVPKNIKLVITIMLVYFGLVPSAAAAVISGVLYRSLAAAVAAASAVNIVVGAVAVSVGGAFLNRGRK